MGQAAEEENLLNLIPCCELPCCESPLQIATVSCDYTLRMGRETGPSEWAESFVRMGCFSAGPSVVNEIGWFATACCECCEWGGYFLKFKLILAITCHVYDNFDISGNFPIFIIER